MIALGKHALPASLFFITLLSCRAAVHQPPPVQVVRLVDLFPSAVVAGSAGAPSEIPPTEWRFDAGGDLGWKAGVGVTGLQVREGRLAGTTTADFPIIHVERSSGLDEPDVLHSVEVRARVSKGGNLEMIVVGDRVLDLGASIRRARLLGWPFKTPVVPGDDFQTYTITHADSRIPSFSASTTRHVLLRPLDQAGAEFEIESVRLVFRKEHLQSIPSGVSWQGFGDVYRETLVTRSPESARFEVDLPSRPWLDLAVGTVEEGPVTFLVEVEEGGERKRVLEKTVTTAHRWEPAPVALDGFASRRVTVSLSVSAQNDGALGFWGAPAVRDRVTPSQATGPRPPRGVILVRRRYPPPRSLEGLWIPSGHRAAPVATRLRGDPVPRQPVAGNMDQGLGAVDPHVSLSHDARHQEGHRSPPSFGYNARRDLPSGGLCDAFVLFNPLDWKGDQSAPGVRGASRAHVSQAARRREHEQNRPRPPGSTASMARSAPGPGVFHLLPRHGSP